MEYSGKLPKNVNCPELFSLNSSVFVVLLVVAILGGISYFVYNKITGKSEKFYLNQMTPLEPMVYRCPYRHQQCPRDCPYFSSNI